MISLATFGLGSSVPNVSKTRSTAAEIRLKRARLEANEAIGQFLESLPDPVVLIDDHRQIVLANREALTLFGQAKLEAVLGKRPGEALDCIHSSDGEDGCGTGPNCRHCGLARAILSSWSNKQKTEGDCCVTSNADGSTLYEIRATASPVVMNGVAVNLVVLKDTSGENQRRMLERLFFHDVLNTVSGLCGLAHALNSEELDGEEQLLYRQWQVELTGNLQDEIQHHRTLLLAERGEYQCQISDITLGPLLRELCALYSRHQSASGRRVQLEDPGLATVRSDASLLRRTLGNLIKNAVEATPMGGCISVATEEDDRQVRFTIQNPGAIPPEVAAHLFHRFHSTKGGSGRGLGTYSAKLFGERFLGGRLEFSTSEAEGTRFVFTIPREI